MKDSQTGAIEPKPIQRTPSGVLSRFWPIDELPQPAMLAFLFTVIVMVLYRQLSQPEGGDSAIWDYVAQCILRGQIPYRDVIEIKTPGSAYLSALSMWVGSWLGVRDVMAVRLMQIAFVGLLSTTTYLTARNYLGSRSAALIAFMIPLMSSYYVGWMLEGTQPKLSMTLFGMVTIVLISRDKPFWAGFCSMLSCLCWQPGLLFTGTAVLIFSRYLTTWRDRRALQVIAGAAVPLIIVALYYYFAGAFKEFWTWTVTYNYNVYMPHGMNSLWDQVNQIWRVLWRVLGANIALLAIALAGMFIFAAERAGARLKGREGLRSANLFKDALIIAPAVYLLFCLVDFQSGPDLIPLFPFIGIFAAWFVVKMGLYLTRSRALNQNAVFKLYGARGAAIAIALLFTLACAVSFKAQGGTLQDQYREYQTLSDMLNPEDKIYAHGSVEILVLLNRPNLNPYIMWNQGKDIFVATQSYCGAFEAILDEIESQRPKIIAVSRLNDVSSRAQIERWVEEHYDKLEGYNHRVYLRRPATAFTSTSSLHPRILKSRRSFMRLTA